MPNLGYLASENASWQRCLQTLSDALALYPDDYRICRHVADVQRWNSEKKQTVEELIVARANNIKLHNFR